MIIRCNTLEEENDKLNSNLSIVNENLEKLSKENKNVSKIIESKHQTRSHTDDVVCNSYPSY